MRGLAEGVALTLDSEPGKVWVMLEFFYNHRETNVLSHPSLSKPRIQV
jgi:hypothetical protein